MSREILITGATGTLGSQVVAAALAAGHRVHALSRRERTGDSSVRWHRGDLLEGSGIDEAVDGVDAIVNCATQPTGDKDVASMQNLTSAVRRTGAAHLVHVSIVGIDRIPLPYYKTKLRVEQVVEASGVAHTLLRATQFHDLILTVAQQMAKLPVVPLPAGFRVQPVEADEVAARLVELALGEPAGLVPDIGGPRVYGAAELLRGYLRATKRRRPIVAIPLPGKAARALGDGANLAPEQAEGQRTWEEFLADRAS